MARKVIDIIYNLVRRRLAQSGAYDRGPGITSLPNSMDVEAGMQQIFKQLREGGLNPVSADKLIKNEEDLLRVIEEINADIAARRKASEGLERIFDKMDRGIPLNPSDQKAVEGAGMKTTLDAFKGFEPKVIQGGKAAETEAEMLARMNRQNKESVQRIKDKKAVEESLQKLEDSKKPQKTLQDLLDDYDGDPDAMADGGLATMFRKK